jgi:1-acyl-sn-glycerol-3-phosphate acyltransferase
MNLVAPTPSVSAASRPVTGGARRTSEVAAPNSAVPKPLRKNSGAGSSRITHHASLPRISPRLLRAFTAYSRWYVGRHFHAVRVSETGLPPAIHGLPLVLYVNHAAWWDPLACLLLQQEFFRERRAFAPIDARALRQYRFFAKLGFFGVEQDSPRGAVSFLRHATAILQHSDTALWLTPQGRFADARERPVRFKPGLGHLPERVGRAVFVPVALEYTFWEERKPELLVRFGEAEILGRDVGQPPAAETWTRHFEQRLEATQTALANDAQARNPTRFRSVLRSGSGVGFFYDAWRRWRARLRGERFRSEHGRL